ncbi:serine protease easter-like, partial [Asbolus verrucosus]
MVYNCETPNNDTGYCMPLTNCTKLMNQLENHDARDFLKKSHCGPKNENPSNPYLLSSIQVKEDPMPKSCGYQRVAIRGRILGGKKAALGEFPWMARLIHKHPDSERKTFGCAGFLIAAKYVLTAAHCLESENVPILGPIYEVQFGEHNTETKIDCNSKNTVCADKPQVIRIKKNIVHPHYSVTSTNHHNDIGLIHLKKSAKFTNYVSPICLLDKVDFEPFEYWISGWESFSSIKMKVSLPPYPHSNCTEKYSHINIQINNKQLCAGGIKNKDSCTGDSGGPLMLVKNGNHWFAAGVVSYGLGCGKEGWPGVYSNITSYFDWIQILTECTTPEAKTGYCVEIYKCLSLLSLHNMSVINTFKCGPSNENRKHPKVCCETDFLQLTTNPPPQPKNPLPASCGVQNVSTSSRILGGESSLPGEFPWMVRLLRKNSMDTITFSCTGALISARVVLTTAHCLVAPNLEYLGSLYVITLGEHETECGFGNNKCLQHKQTAMVSETIAHPDYNNTDKSHDNDIGLIILKQDVELSDFIAPICLLEEGYETSEYVISGWGKTESSLYKIRQQEQFTKSNNCRKYKYSQVKNCIATVLLATMLRQIRYYQNKGNNAPDLCWRSQGARFVSRRFRGTFNGTKARKTMVRSWFELRSSCTTPNGETARCVSIHSCPILYDAVTTQNRQQILFLRESQCGYGSDPLEGDRILDGQVTSLTEFPWMALLQYRKKNGNLVFSCGGSLISSRYVLTAAHCVKGQILTKIGPLVNVRLGEYNTETEKDCSNQLGFEMCNDKPFDSAIDKITVHPNHNEGSVDRYHDIALIKLKRQAPTTDFIKPICLPTKSERSNVGDKLVVAGWGRTEYASSSPVKLKLWVPIVASSQCSTRFRTAGVSLGSRQLCAGGERGRDSCNGDSGGPLMSTTKNDSAQWYIEGVVSFGAKCGTEGWPGIYTRVSEYVDWIRNNVD